jgi:hypothetical protein
MDIGLQVSFSETFNIVSADFVSMGVPIVVSGEVPWAPRFIKASPTDSQAIASKMVTLIRLRNTSIVQKLCRYCLNNQSYRSLKDWLRVI